MISELIATRKEMRAKRDEAIAKGVIALLDIGSAKLSVMLVQFLPATEIGGQMAFRVLAARDFASTGVEYGQVVSIARAEVDILRALQSLQKSAGVRVDYAVVNFSGGQPHSHAVSGRASVPSGEVGKADIAAAMANAEIPDLPPDREYLHAFPVNFSLDQTTGHLDPMGQMAAEISVDMHLISIDSASLRNTETVIRRAQMDLVGVTTSAFLSGLSTLIEDEQELGSVIVDMGAMVTTMAIFMRKQLLYVHSLPIGGHHITNDIAQLLNIDFRAAERLKTLHGGALATSADDRDELEFISAGAEERQFLTRAELIGIIRPRLEELLTGLTHAFEEAGVEHLPSSRVVLTGGASQLSGLTGLAERYLGTNLRLGRTMRLSGAPDAHAGPAYAALSGLALHISAPRDELWDFDLGYDVHSAIGVRAIFNWFRNAW